MNTRTTQGRQIVEDLLGDGFVQWETATKDDGVALNDIDMLRAERYFTNNIIVRLTDDDEATAELITTLLVRSACEIFTSLTENWDDAMLANVPAIVTGLAKAEAWLEEAED